MATCRPVITDLAIKGANFGWPKQQFCACAQCFVMKNTKLLKTQGHKLDPNSRVLTRKFWDNEANLNGDSIF